MYLQRRFLGFSGGFWTTAVGQFFCSELKALMPLLVTYNQFNIGSGFFYVQVFKFKCAFDMDYFCQLISLFSLFLLLFIGLTILFQLIFTFIYSIFSKKIFNFNKISGFQMDHKCIYYHTLSFGGWNLYINLIFGQGQPNIIWDLRQKIYVRLFICKY